MKMFKYFKTIMIVLVILVAQSCKKTSVKNETVQEVEKIQQEISLPQEEEKQVVIVDTPKTLSLLDSIRLEIHQDYRTYVQQDKPDTTAVSQVTQSIACTPCDMDFLIYLSQKDDYNLKDIKTLLCLDDNDVCDDNAEFVPFYNEIVFKVFNRERADLSFNQIDSLLQDEELVEELESPMSDTNSTNLIDMLRTGN